MSQENRIQLNTVHRDQVKTPAHDEHAGIQYGIQKIYLKDLSFESPKTPQVFLDQEMKPEISLDLGVKHQRLEEGLYEVVLHVTATLAFEKATIFLVEVQKAGIFTITHVDTAQLNYMLGSYCPNVLFPYVREIVSQTVSRGGFPPLLLAPVNFDAFYEEQQKKNTAAVVS
jgi:preprotein translocase subunit SecB